MSIRIMKSAKRSEPRPSPRGIKVMFDGYVKSPDAALRFILTSLRRTEKYAILSEADSPT
jgi:hypothetical protein